jgi:hypothetical protein
VTGQNGRTLFNRPKLTPGCRANGRRRIHDSSVCLCINHKGISYPKNNSTFCPHIKYDVLQVLFKMSSDFSLNVSRLVAEMEIQCV